LAVFGYLKLFFYAAKRASQAEPVMKKGFPYFKRTNCVNKILLNHIPEKPVY